MKIVVTMLAALGVCGAMALVGCGASVDVDGEDDGEGGGGQCLAAPACGPSEVQVDACSNDTCHPVSICGSEILCEESLESCNAYPGCNPGDVEVPACSSPDCYEVTLCGSTISCVPGEECIEDPACDPGDIEVGDCTDNGVPCYYVTECDLTIACVDEWPEHGCPEEMPVTGSSCDDIAQVTSCTYPTSPGCVEFYECQLVGTPAWEWAFVGGGCEG